MAAGLADDQRQLAFEIEIVGDLGPDHLAAVADQRVGEADEHARLLRQFAAHFGGVGAVIDAGAENLVRLGNERQEFYVAELMIGLGGLCRLAHRLHRAGRERCAQIGLADFVVQRNDAVAAHRAEALLAAGDKTQKPH